MTGTTTATRALATFGVLALALAGCSGSDGDAQPEPSAVASSPAPTPGSDAAEPEQSLPARWWSWAGDAPAGENPIADTTGEFCAQGQPDDVFFLAGTFGETGVERSCTVPVGRPVYFPLLNSICPIQGEQTDVKAFDDCTMDGRAEATLDGKAVESEEQTSGARFRFAPARSNDLSDYAGDAVAWGMWAGPLTLTPGKHTLEISAKSGDFAVGVTYALTVE